MDRAINIIGVASVVGSLIFVGLELSQSQQIALAGQVQARLEKTLDRNRTWFEGQWELGYKIATTPYEELSDPEKWVRDEDMVWAQMIQQFSLYQYSVGLLDEDQWEVTKAYIERRWNDCQLRHTYDFETLEPAYVSYLRSLDDPCV